jgi:hypothetical protein
MKESARAMNVLLVLVCLLPLIACMTNRVDLAASSGQSAPAQKISILKRIEYDVKGRPFFGVPLEQRPSKTGEQFTLVSYLAGRPFQSYDIVVRGEEGPDLMRPLEVIYHWTGEGFQGGMALTQGMQGFSGSAEALAGYLTVKLVTAAAGGVVGFAVGVIASIPEAAGELKKVIVNARENVVSYTRYEYDAQGRIASMRMYAPGDAPIELVRTEYFYTGIESLPSKTVVTSYPENKVRTIP